MELKRNIFGILITIMGAQVFGIAGLLNHSSGVLIFALLILGIVMMLAGLFFMEGVITGATLAFSGLQLIFYDVILTHVLMWEFTSASLFLIIGWFMLIIGIGIVIFSFREDVGS